MGYLDKLAGAGYLSQVLFALHWSLFFLALLLFIIGRWMLGILAVGAGLLTVLISYRLPAGRRNPVIWKNKDLYDLLRHAALSGEAKIGFHSLRDQMPLLAKLETIGLRKKPSEGTRQFIRERIVGDRRAFEICRDDMIIEMIHDGETCFWNGYGKIKSAQDFHKAEIMFEIESSADYMFFGALDGLSFNDSGDERRLSSQ